MTCLPCWRAIFPMAYSKWVLPSPIPRTGRADCKRGPDFLQPPCKPHEPADSRNPQQSYRRFVARIHGRGTGVCRWGQNWGCKGNLRRRCCNRFTDRFLIIFVVNDELDLLRSFHQTIQQPHDRAGQPFLQPVTGKSILHTHRKSTLVIFHQFRRTNPRLEGGL